MQGTARTVLVWAPTWLEYRAVWRAFGLGAQAVIKAGRKPVGFADIVGIGAVGMKKSLGRMEALPGGVGEGLMRVVLVGVGGGLDPALATGDVVVDGCEPPVSAEGVQAVRRGKVVGSGAIVDTAEAKRRLREETGGDVVDMELNVVRAAMAARGVNVVAVRAVSDAADDALNPALLGIVDAMGGVRPAALTGAILSRRVGIGELMTVGRNAKRAARNAAEVAACLVDEWAAAGDIG